MIRATDIEVTFGAQAVLRGITAQIEHGKITAVLGPNGAGKSVLLRCLAGSYKPDYGTIELEQKPLADYSLRELATMRAVLSQSNPIHFPFKVREIVMMGRNPYSDTSSSSNDNTACSEALEYIDAQHLQERSFPDLSGGEQQRVHLARVLAQLWRQRDAYLLLDEPTSALDLKHQHQLFSVLKELAEQQNFAVCVVLHDIHLAKRYTDRVILLTDGALFEAGDTKTVLNDNAIKRVFGIDPKLVPALG